MAIFTSLLSLVAPLHCDVPYPWQIGFQDGATPTFEGIVELHDTIFFYLVVISFLVFWMLAVILMKFSSNKVGIVHKYSNHGTLIELIWTITPALILIAIAFPSFKLLYLMDEVISPTMTVKVAGHQWYWSVNCPDELGFEPHIFNASALTHFITSVEDLKSTCRPLLSSDIPLVPSQNHNNTLDVLNQALDSDLFSSEVREFITKVRGQHYDSLCHITETGDLVLPKGTSLGHLGQLPSLTRTSGIYMILQSDSDNGYIGSSIDLASRLRSHRDLAFSSSMTETQHRLYSLVQEHSADSFTFHHIHTGTNFVEEFISTHPKYNLTAKDIELLTAFTKYELAVVEQAYLDAFKPSLNGRFIATTSTHPHMLAPVVDSSTEVPFVVEETLSEELNHEVNTTPKVDISHWVTDENLPVQIYDMNSNPLGSFKSLRSAARELHTSHQLLSRYAKSVSHWHSPYLDIEIHIEIKGTDKEGTVVHPTSNSHPALVHNLELVENRIYAITADLKTIFGNYPSVYAAAAAHQVVDYKRINRYVGMKKLIKTNLGTFYFTAHEETFKKISDRKPHESKPVLVLDLNTGISRQYPSVTKASKALKLHHDFINKHLDRGAYTSLDGTRRFKFTSGQ